MKKFFNLLYASLLISLYAFAIGLATQNLYRVSHGVYNENSEQKAYFNTGSVSLFAHTTESYTSGEHKTSETADYKIPFNGNILSFYNKEILLAAIDKQYRQKTHNFLIESRKKDLIYPFHYFW
ncbi:hypothetical protein [Mesonia sp. K7]|uniref:hypothetical protein n=1 Tax=Mesonia sp. K7 TaxID=2218606 RepID=UPI000DB7E065|nr:hypothetical protein [Mesonia sp. K7]PZD78525.1 hypothetical protein DNG35_05545 [Mesonia sp. K7]